MSQIICLYCSRVQSSLKYFYSYLHYTRLGMQSINTYSYKDTQQTQEKYTIKAWVFNLIYSTNFVNYSQDKLKFIIIGFQCQYNAYTSYKVIQFLLFVLNKMYSLLPIIQMLVPYQWYHWNLKINIIDQSWSIINPVYIVPLLLLLQPISITV